MIGTITRMLGSNVFKVSAGFGAGISIGAKWDTDDVIKCIGDVSTNHAWFFDYMTDISI